MLSNWIFRLNQWLSQWTYGEYRRKRKQWKFEGHDD